MLPALLAAPQMAMETAHMDPAAHRTRVLHWIDVGTTATFAAEAALKVVAFGFRPYWSFNTNKVGRRAGREGSQMGGWAGSRQAVG